MADLVLPSNPPPSSVEWRLLDNTSGGSPGPWGAMQTVSRPGNRWACRISWENLKDANRHKLLALVASLRGRANRLWVNDITALQRGSMSAPELFTNADFSNGTTGWTAYNSTLSIVNGFIRAKSNGGFNDFGMSQTCTVTPYAPHISRAFVSQSLLASDSLLSEMSTTIPVNTSYAARSGYVKHAGVPSASSSGVYPAWHNGTSDGLARSQRFLDISFSSLSRCFLADGGPNLLTYSDQLENAAWSRTGLTTVSANADTAPDGTSTADALAEDGTSGVHRIFQAATVSSAVADYTMGVFLKANGRNFAALQIQESIGGTGITQYVNLSTGALLTSSTGANWANLRATPGVDCGNGWWFFTLTGLKNNAATGVTALVYCASADNVNSYTGSNPNGIRVWRAICAQSSTATRGALTTTVSVSAQTQTGAALYVKGLPASTNGLLAAGDAVEIIAGTRSHYARLISDLDSDAASLGYMQFEPPCPWQIADNAPVIVQKPMVKMMLAEGDNGWPTRPGMFSDFSIELVQDVA